MAALEYLLPHPLLAEDLNRHLECDHLITCFI